MDILSVYPLFRHPLRQSSGQYGNINDNLATFLRIALAEDDLSIARTYLGQLETWTKDHGGDGIEDPMLTYLSIAQAHLVLGDKESSLRAIADGYDLLMDRAAHITDESARASYLANVPTNRTLIAWHKQGHPSSD